MASMARRFAIGLVATALLASGAPGAAADAMRGPAAERGARSAQRGPGRMASAERELLRHTQRVASASVLVRAGDKACAGSVVGNATQVLTAAHCVPAGLDEVEVVAGRQRIDAVVALLDRTRDTALLALVEPLDVEPLELARELPTPGDRILFVGRTDRRSHAQVARVTHLGSCPSLPGVSDAVFTTLQARPGDSGAPILNEAMRVVGVVHGGAACHIAAPTAALARKLGRPEPDAEFEVSPEPSGAESNSSGVPAPHAPTPAADPGATVSPVDRYELGPFVFERYRRAGSAGFRLRLQVGDSTH